MPTLPPPRFLQGFVARPTTDPGIDTDPPPENWENRFFSIACECGGSTFAVRSFFNPHFYLEYETAYGPVTLRCTTCLQERESFDPSKHGYDVEIDHWPPDDDFGGIDKEFACPHCSGADFALTVVLEYPPDVLQAEAAEEGRSAASSGPKPEDLFGYFTLVGRCSGCGVLTTISDVECA
jgi:hypothetical protein